jgi:hypothetical protein
MTDHEAIELAVQCKATGDGLYAMMKYRPELFAHIKQEQVRYRPEEWVSVAEKLAKEHGTLPCGNWLKKNGHSGLVSAMRCRPELFSHIKQEKVGKNPEEWIPIAEKLEKEHGTLPCGAWLEKNGYSALYQAMRKRPELFAHIKQEKKVGKKPEEWIPIAERLEKEHGTLPCVDWLCENGYSGLNYVMKKHPGWFAHISQESKAGKKREEWVPIAEKLAQEHGGTLPNAFWLQKNGYRGLYRAMKSRPELFAHIKRKRAA